MWSNLLGVKYDDYIPSKNDVLILRLQCKAMIENLSPQLDVQEINEDQKSVTITN